MFGSNKANERKEDVRKLRWVALVCGLGMVLGVGAYLFSERTPATDQLDAEVAEVVEDGPVEEVEAQTTTTSGLSVDEQRVLRNIVRDTKAADAERAARAQRVLNRGFHSGLPKLGPAVARLGLAGAAAGIWYHNGVELYYGLNPEETIVIESEYKKAPDTLYAYEGDTAGGLVFEGAITHVDWSLDSQGYARAALTVDGKCYAESCSSSLAAFGVANVFSVRAYESGTYNLGPTYKRSGSTQFPLYSQNGSYADPKSGITWGQNLCNIRGCSTTYEPEIYQVGASSVTTESGADYSSTVQETQGVVDAIEADAEYDPAWAEHPWGPNWKPGPEEPGIRPPGTDTGDQEIFGPERYREDREGRNFEVVFFEDGTLRFDDMNSTSRIYRNGTRMIWSHYPPGGPIEYDYWDPEDDNAGVVDCMGVSHTIKYADGVVRERILPDGTLPSEADAVEPECENWWDSDGQPIAVPSDLTAYPVQALWIPEEPTDWTGAWPEF